MKREEIFAKIQSLVVDQLQVDASEVSLESTIQEDLGADSIEVVELIMILEQEFDLPEIPDSDAEKMSTIGDVVDYIVRVKG